MASDSEKTTRIGLLCFSLVALGFLWFLNKANACALACNSCSSPSVCHDEFYEFKDNSTTHDYECSTGARAEVVNSPPAPKAGVLCHCINSPEDAGVASAPTH